MNTDSSNKDKQKSLAIAVLLYALLLLVFFFVRFWPPSNLEEITGGGGGGGMTINFGDTDFGKGNDFSSKDLDVQQATKPVATPTPEENIIAQDNDDDVISVPKNETKKNKPVTPKPEKKPEVQPKPIVKKTDDALANILKGNKKGGDGNSTRSGNQGNANGSINSSGYLGSGGSGGGTGGGNGTGNGTGTGEGTGSGSGGGNGSGNGRGNGSGYALAGRKAISKPQPAYNCNEEGTVVVQITVDENGNVTEAKPGARGTTNTANCLASQAKIAALNTKWNPSPDGTQKQVGTITYNFKIRD